MLLWILQHKIGVGIAVLAIALLLWWLLKPPTWKDGMGDNDGLAYLDRFRASH
jgi:hypothetical protein